MKERGCWCQVIDCYAEFLAALRAMKNHHVEALAKAGVGLAELLGVDWVGVARILIDDDDIYHPSEDGRPAVIVAVWDMEEIVDLVAFRLDDEGHFWRRRALLGLLGLPIAEWCAEFDWPLSIYTSPLSWLRHGGAGVCVLDTKCWKTQLVLQQQHNLICEGENLAAAIDALVLQREPRELPTISYRGKKEWPIL